MEFWWPIELYHSVADKADQFITSMRILAPASKAQTCSMETPSCASISAEFRQVRFAAKSEIAGIWRTNCYLPTCSLITSWWGLEATIIPFPRKNVNSNSEFSLRGRLHHQETLPGFGIPPGLQNVVWSLPVAVVNLSGDFLLELRQLILGKGPGQYLRPPLDQAVSQLLDVPKLCCFVVLQKIKGQF